MVDYRLPLEPRLKTTRAGCKYSRLLLFGTGCTGKESWTGLATRSKTTAHALSAQPGMKTDGIGWSLWKAAHRPARALSYSETTTSGVLRVAERRRACFRLLVLLDEAGRFEVFVLRLLLEELDGRLRRAGLAAAALLAVPELAEVRRRRFLAAGLALADAEEADGFFALRRLELAELELLAGRFGVLLGVLRRRLVGVCLPSTCSRSVSTMGPAVAGSMPSFLATALASSSLANSVKSGFCLPSCEVAVPLPMACNKSPMLKRSPAAPCDRASSVAESR